MSKKHFKLLAEAIAEIKDIETRKEVAYKIGSVCNLVNSLFDWHRWNIACNINPNESK